MKWLAKLSEWHPEVLQSFRSEIQPTVNVTAANHTAGALTWALVEEAISDRQTAVVACGCLVAVLFMLSGVFSVWYSMEKHTIPRKPQPQLIYDDHTQYTESRYDGDGYSDGGHLTHNDPLITPALSEVGVHSAVPSEAGDMAEPDSAGGLPRSPRLTAATDDNQ